MATSRNIALINAREAVKAYSPELIPQADWEQVLAMIQGSPTSFGLEPYRVLVIDRRNADLLKDLQAAAGNQGIVTQCDKLVLFISLRRNVVFSEAGIKARYAAITASVLKHLDEGAQQKTVDFMSGIIYENLRMNEHPSDQYAMKQAYIGLAAGMIGASLLGIGSTPMEGFNRALLEPLLVQQKLLDLGTERVAVMCAFGYPASKTAYAHGGSGKRVRVPFDKKFTIL